MTDINEGYADGYDGYDDQDACEPQVTEAGSKLSISKGKDSGVKLLDSNLGQISDIFSNEDLGVLKLAAFFNNKK